MTRPYAYDDALRMFAGHITTVDPACRSVAEIQHRHIEAHKTWMASRPGRGGGKLSTTTISHRLCFLRTLFERSIDWDYDDAPRRCPIYKGDFPERDEPLPKFLDDPTAAKFMAALATDPDKRRRLMVELLARTGIRAGELVQGELGKAVQQLKREPGRGLFVGGVTLPLALADLGLIDEYELVVQPHPGGPRADVVRRPERAARAEARGAPGVPGGGGRSALPAQSSHGLKVGCRWARGPGNSATTPRSTQACPRTPGA